MIDLIVNNTSLDVLPGFVFSITRSNNIFEFNTWQGDISTSFSLPLTANNKTLLGHPEDVRSPYYFQYVDCQVKYDGALLYTGSLVVTEANAQAITCHFVVGLGEFARLTNKKSLRGDWYGGNKTLDVNQTVYDSDVDEWALFPVQNDEFGQGGELGVYFSQQNKRSETLNSFLSGADDYIDPQNNLVKYAITPFPYVVAVIERIFLHFGYNVQENFLRTDSELKTLTVYNNFDVHQLTLTYTLEQRVVNNARRDSSVTGTIDIRTATFTRTAGTFRFEECLPDVSIHEFLFAIANTFNLAYVFDDWRNVRILRRQDIINNVAFEDITHMAEAESLELEFEELFQGFHIVHKPASAAEEAANFLDIENFIDRWRENVTDVNDLQNVANPQISEVVYSTTEDWFYNYSAIEENVGGTIQQNAQWVGIARGFYTSYINGTTTEPSYVNDRWGSLPLRQDFVDGNADLFTVNTATAAFTDSLVASFPTEFILRTQVKGGERDNDKNVLLSDIILMFHRPNTVNAFSVITGYVDIYDENDAPIAGTTLALRIDQPEGIYKRFFADYLFWWIEAKKEASANMLPDLTFIKKIDFTGKYRIGETNYFIKEINLAFTGSGIGVASLELYTAQPSPLPIVV